MYSLLIADDEPIIRKGVKKIIDWESLGFSQIFLAEDGQEALDIIRNNKIDLVLTDIVMPFMNGLELSEILSREYPDIHVVILTGHEDFEYAKQSMDFGVKNYILKPVGAETLYNKMKKICDSLYMENEKKEYISSMKKQLQQSLPAFREQMLNRIVCIENGNVSQYLEQSSSLGLDLSKGPFMVAAVDIDMIKIAVEDYALYSFAARNIAMESIGKDHYIFEDTKGKIAILFQCRFLGEEFHDTVYQTLCVIQKAITNNLKIDSTCGIGSEVNSPQELYYSYINARKAVECKYSLGTNNVYDITDMHYLENTFCYPLNEIKILLNAVKFKEKDEIRDAVNNLVYNKNLHGKISGINVRMIYMEIVISLLREISDVKEVSEKIWNHGFDIIRDMELVGIQNIMVDKLYLFACEVKEEIDKIQERSTIQIIENVKAYVAKNYKDPNISLSTAAKYAGVSTGYLSGLFKKEVGTNFVKYLTDMRMEESMKLLRTTDLKTYEIAYETGFSNPHYFSIAFKKYTGMSPSDFRMKE